jgi:hypothetical protein
MEYSRCAELHYRGLLHGADWNRHFRVEDNPQSTARQKPRMRNELLCRQQNQADFRKPCAMVRPLPLSQILICVRPPKTGSTQFEHASSNGIANRNRF